MHSVPGLAQSRRLATLALLTACTVWVVSLLLKRLFPAFHLPLETPDFTNWCAGNWSLSQPRS